MLVPICLLFFFFGVVDETKQRKSFFSSKSDNESIKLSPEPKGGRGGPHLSHCYVYFAREVD